MPMARVFWDTNLFIYLFEHNAEWSTRVIEFRQRMVARGDELLTSYLYSWRGANKAKGDGQFDPREELSQLFCQRAYRTDCI